MVGTGHYVGKTFVSTVLAAGLNADYWKPVQYGYNLQTDADWVISTLNYPRSRVYPAVYYDDRTALEVLMNVKDRPLPDLPLQRFRPPRTLEPIIIETAGGLMTPVASQLATLDLLRYWQVPIVLVSEMDPDVVSNLNLYLSVLEANELPVLGYLLNGHAMPGAAASLAKLVDARFLGWVPYTTGRHAPGVMRSLFRDHVFWPTDHPLA